MSDRAIELVERRRAKMNPQIRALMDEAKLQAYYDAQQDHIEKFAELIVTEMLQTCEDHPAWTGRMIGEQIKQHFGVEE